MPTLAFTVPDPRSFSLEPSPRTVLILKVLIIIAMIIYVGTLQVLVVRNWQLVYSERPASWVTVGIPRMDPIQSKEPTPCHREIHAAVSAFLEGFAHKDLSREQSLQSFSRFINDFVSRISGETVQSSFPKISDSEEVNFIRHSSNQDLSVLLRDIRPLDISSQDSDMANSEWNIMSRCDDLESSTSTDYYQEHADALGIVLGSLDVGLDKTINTDQEFIRHFLGDHSQRIEIDTKEVGTCSLSFQYHGERFDVRAGADVDSFLRPPSNSALPLLSRNMYDQAGFLSYVTEQFDSRQTGNSTAATSRFKENKRLALMSWLTAGHYNQVPCLTLSGFDLPQGQTAFANSSPMFKSKGILGQNQRDLSIESSVYQVSTRHSTESMQSRRTEGLDLFHRLTRLRAPDPRRSNSMPPQTRGAYRRSLSL